jgi:hypothetical protein
MRGSLKLLRKIDLLGGIIPAHAGLTDDKETANRGEWDHPRACGAHEESSKRVPESAGSSPRMRGSPPSTRAYSSPNGIIPAHAGLTVSIVTKGTLNWDHPRACGAHHRDVYQMICEKGSSPRMRGSLDMGQSRSSTMGIIPAHAGLTYSVSHSLTRCRDHPRACGAHAPFATRPFSQMGSSPRMRGSPSANNNTNAQPGIIPAHAGLTTDEGKSYILKGDHPRACGAHPISMT